MQKLKSAYSVEAKHFIGKFLNIVGYRLILISLDVIYASQKFSAKV
tara:strand:+ start:82 stop:219 length:138 start_codon:yes stop_codon:yes gene_type:complete